MFTPRCPIITVEKKNLSIGGFRWRNVIQGSQQESNVHFEKVFSDIYEQRFTDTYAEGQTVTSGEISEEAYEAGYDNG